MNRFFAVGLGVFLSLGNATAAFYDYGGNGSTTGGGAVGNGSLRLSSSGGTVSITLTRGSGSFNDVLVLFIDSKTGGFSSTSAFSDTQNGLTKAISGFSVAGRSTATFATGFAADYAIAIGVNQGASVYELASGSTFGDPIHFLRGPFENPNSASYSVSFDWVDIGLGDVGATKNFTFESSYLTATGSRYLESFESLSGSGGFNSVTFANYDSFPVVPVPETTNAALAIFGGITLGTGLLGRARRFFSKTIRVK